VSGEKNQNQAANDSSVALPEEAGRQRPKLSLFLFPFLVVLLAFGFDKLFFIGHVEDYFLTTASFLNFDHKVEMLDELEAYTKTPNHRKTLVLFGNSRTMSFSREYIEANYHDWTLFNFSVPGGTTDYFYYLMQQIQKRDIHPDVVYFAVTPQGMNAKAAVALDEVMVFGLPPSFLLHEFRYYTLDELTNYIAKKAFLVYRYRPKLRTIEWRLSASGNEGQHQVDNFRNMLATTKKSLEEHRGSVPYDLDIKPAQNTDAINENAASIWKDAFVPFQLNEGQVFFTRESLLLAKKLGAKTGIVWPRVSEPLRRLKETEKVVADRSTGQADTVRHVFEPRMKQLAKDTGSVWMDFNYDSSFAIGCEYFFDASHMASGCFRPFMDRLMNEVLR